MQTFALLRSAALTLFTCLALPAVASVVIDDRFDNGNLSGPASAPDFWKLQTVTGDNGVFENNGYLTLFATTHPYTFAGINSALDPRLNFFQRPMSIVVEDLIFNFKDVSPSQAVFRLSLNSSELRQNMAKQSVSLRFVGGAVLFGFKTAELDKLAAEDMSGTERGSVIFERFDGKPTGFQLTLDPHAEPGYVHVTLMVRTDGSRPVITRTGRMNLRAADWETGGASALVMEARRNIDGHNADSYVSASLGRLAVTLY